MGEENRIAKKNNREPLKHIPLVANDVNMSALL